MQKNLTARLARQELQETPQLARWGICKRLTPAFAQQRPQGLQHQNVGILTQLWAPPADPQHLPEIGSAGRSL